MASTEAVAISFPSTSLIVHDRRMAPGQDVDDNSVLQEETAGNGGTVLAAAE